MRPWTVAQVLVGIFESLTGVRLNGRCATALRMLTSRGIVPISGRLRLAVLLAGAGLLGACTLPWQQLKLPGPVPPKAGPAPIAKANRSPGSPLTPGAAEVAGAQVSAGSGQFTGSPEPRPTAGAANSKDGVTLNFAGASVAEAARSILGDILGLDYSVSDKIKGSITIQTVRPIPKEALLGVFETMLAGEGAAISVDNGVYRILPSNDAVSAAGIVARGARRLPGVSAQVVPLRYVAAAEMERIIKSMAPQATILRTDPARNLMVVAGTRGDLGLHHGRGQHLRRRLDAGNVLRAIPDRDQRSRGDRTESSIRSLPTTRKARPRAWCALCQTAVSRPFW